MRTHSYFGLMLAFSRQGQVHPMLVCDNYRGMHRPYHRQCNHTPALHNSFFAEAAANRYRRSGAVCGDIRGTIQEAEAELNRSRAAGEETFTHTFKPLKSLPEIWVKEDARQVRSMLSRNGGCDKSTTRT